MPVSSARWAAFQVLLRVETGSGFSDELMHSDLTARLDDRDAGLTQQLVLGVLRTQGQLDESIRNFGGRPPEKLDLEVRLALRLGLFQLYSLDRVPPRAAVSESVEIVKRARKASAAGFVNVVLRKAARASPPHPRPEDAVPPWLLDRWRSHYGNEADRLALATLDPPETYVRLNARFDVEETVRLLAAEGVQLEPTDLPLCRRLCSGRVDRSRCFEQGRVRIQDIGSQRVGELLGPGESFLDVCAAPGGKTSQILEASGGSMPAVACDLHHHRLLTLRRLRTVPVSLVALDAARPLPFRRRFDRILVDAPCSGTGTLRRNPEIKWRLRPEDIHDLAGRQKAILHHGLERLAPGGRLVYSTCSLEPEENQEVVEAVVRAPYRKIEERLWLPSQHPGDGFYACAITC